MSQGRPDDKQPVDESIRALLQRMLDDARLKAVVAARQLHEVPTISSAISAVDDGAEPPVDAEVLVTNLALSTHAAGAIERALARLATGDYGRCEECGTAIATARLKAIPFASRCLGCQADYEEARRRGR